MPSVKRSLQFHAGQGAALTCAGMALVASTYGMARFGVSLLHPAMAVERPGVATALPWAGVAQFASYCLAVGSAAFLVPRRSRIVAGIAGAAAGAGCLGLAVSTSAGWFVTSAFVGGAGAGLASPALVGLLDAVAPERMASTAQAIVNAGTSVGVVGAGVLATAIAAPGVAWPLMAVLCLATGTAVVLLSSGARVTGAGATGARQGTARRMPTLTVPLTSALGAGLISAATWTYGPTAVVARGALEPNQVGLLWIALGLGGLAGAFISRPVVLLGPAKTFLLCTIALLATSVAVLAPDLQGQWWPLIGAACFGGAYMAMSGVLILWGRRIDAQKGAAITAWLFLALAIGQATGAHLLGPAFT